MTTNKQRSPEDSIAMRQDFRYRTPYDKLTSKHHMSTVIIGKILTKHDKEARSGNNDLFVSNRQPWFLSAP